MTTTLASMLDALEARGHGRPETHGPLEIEIARVTQDSRRVEPGSLYTAVKGATHDGHDFIPDAIEQGASALAVERPDTNWSASQVVVEDSRLWTGLLAAANAEFPTEQVSLVGVTGTNGKTSTVTLVEHVANTSGRRASSMGTLTGSLTTSSAPEFQRSIAQYRDSGISIVAAEISSHALDQDRVAGSQFAVGVFTNLTQDHLDYHESMETYFEAKARLFDPQRCGVAIVSTSDDWGRRLVDAIEGPVVAIDTEAIATAAQLDSTGARFEWRGHAVHSPLGGRFSVANAVLAAEACLALGFEIDDIIAALGSAPQIPGRFELIDAGQPYSVIVDYSHTPASVAAAVDSARDLLSVGGAVILVFGAAGDRDAGKRPLMGAAATAADVVIVTSDNPRSEDPEAIIDDVVVGIESTDRQPRSVLRLADRAEAIEHAVSVATAGDVVVIAGKGHEDYQIVGSERLDFDDRVQARKALATAGFGGGQ